MRVIPAVDLRNGACVQLVGGDPREERVNVPDPVAQAQAFRDMGAAWLHVVDLDRAFGTGSNLRVVTRILEALPGMMVQVGGGVRFVEDIDTLLNAGAARVVIGTRAVTDPVFLHEIAKRYGRRVVIALDAKGGHVVAKGWTESTGRDVLEFAREVDGLGVGGILYTDVDREGRMSGANVEGVRRLAAAVSTPVVASGGVRDRADLDALRGTGAWGAVVGMAAYTGAVDMRAALAGEGGKR
ncbi:MAG TPA: 1-(5-phosphoribosyl)-5-[(5-phosphoribosylamino)methylideneamino]imidazole-4-carboxamide isomerase [Candidatus Thermoplasmatota archaeon]|nr:1-(5-phosphoribosyl)-5-[(5-phosphoribosylamino)methylideneamino]imidazole-4-carboxamide isomerase [Candidatus Thermoplasmatota archaeon]